MVFERKIEASKERMLARKTASENDGKQERKQAIKIYRKRERNKEN